MSKRDVLNHQLEKDENDQDRHLRRIMNQAKASQVLKTNPHDLTSPRARASDTPWPRLGECQPEMWMEALVDVIDSIDNSLAQILQILNV